MSVITHITKRVSSHAGNNLFCVFDFTLHTGEIIRRFVTMGVTANIDAVRTTMVAEIESESAMREFRKTVRK